jgi:hypothetical protein
MESIDDILTTIRRLRDAGLVISESEDHERYLMYRPTSVPGNRRVEYEREFLYGPTLIEIAMLDAPLGSLSYLRGQAQPGWVFRVWEWAPGPGPGDFENLYPTLSAAVEAVLEYYFGDPAWMCAQYDRVRLSKRSSSASA